jgi:hypothetical protein
MFLDDELYQIAKRVDYTHWTHKSTTRAALTTCIIIHVIDVQKRVCDGPTPAEELFIAVKRFKTHWYNTLKRLETEGIVLYDPKFELRSYEMILNQMECLKPFSYELFNYIR